MASLKTLDGRLRGAAELLFRLARYNDRTFQVTSARRSATEQARLYEKFKRGESKFPALPPGQSLHEQGRAFDMARPSVDPYQDDLLAALGAVWIGWGGRWSKTDPIHFEA